jgi:polyisoprenoid-binding protein YceI
MIAWQIDNSHSTIEFGVKHMMVTTVPGQFTEFGGDITVDSQNVLNSKVEGWIGTASVTTRDANRDAHLRSADFFDAEQFPRMTFVSKRIERVGGEQYKVIGDITIKGVTREFTFDVTNEGRGKNPWGSEIWGLTAKATLNRKDFGLNWNVALEAGGWLVGDQVKIEVEMQLVKVQEPVAEAVAA